MVWARRNNPALCLFPQHRAGLFGGRVRVSAGLRIPVLQACAALGSPATLNRTILYSGCAAEFCRQLAMDARIFNEFRATVGERGFISSAEELHTYECDGLTNFRVLPSAVLLPSSTEQVQSIVRLCHREKIPFVARGSGTGLSGGARPVANGIVLSLARMNRILEVDIPNARIVVEPGVINLDVSARVQSRNYFY